MSFQVSGTYASIFSLEEKGALFFEAKKEGYKRKDSTYMFSLTPQQIDGLTILAFVLVNCDYGLQIFRVHKRRSAEDIAVTGMMLRICVILCFFIKFDSLEDQTVVVGQLVTMVAYGIYFVSVLYWRFLHKPSKILPPSPS